MIIYGSGHGPSAVVYHALRNFFLKVIHPSYGEAGPWSHNLIDHGMSPQCTINIKFLTQYQYEYICKRKFHRIH